MSLNKISGVKYFSSFIKNSIRRYASQVRLRCPTVIKVSKPQYESRASQTARSPYASERVPCEVTVEHRELPQHQPDALMPPLRQAEYINLSHQQNILNGPRRVTQSEVAEGISTADKVRLLEESRKRHQKMLDLMRQQQELWEQQDERQGGSVSSARCALRQGEERKLEAIQIPRGSRDSATVHVVKAQPSTHTQRPLQMPPRQQKLYRTRERYWPENSARHHYHCDTSDSSDSEYGEYLHDDNDRRTTREVVEFHKNRSNDLDRRAFRGIYKQSATQRVSEKIRYRW